MFVKIFIFQKKKTTIFKLALTIFKVYTLLKTP